MRVKDWERRDMKTGGRAGEIETGDKVAGGEKEDGRRGEGGRKEGRKGRKGSEEIDCKEDTEGMEGWECNGRQQWLIYVICLYLD